MPRQGVIRHSIRHTQHFRYVVREFLRCLVIIFAVLSSKPKPRLTGWAALRSTVHLVRRWSVRCEAMPALSCQYFSSLLLSRDWLAVPYRVLFSTSWSFPRLAISITTIPAPDCGHRSPASNRFCHTLSHLKAAERCPVFLGGFNPSRFTPEYK